MNLLRKQLNANQWLLRKVVYNSKAFWYHKGYEHGMQDAIAIVEGRPYLAKIATPSGLD